MLGREATTLDVELGFTLRSSAPSAPGPACRNGQFFPRAAVTNLDGHRKCGVRLEPAQSASTGDVPGCGKPLTIGVLTG